MTDNFIEVYKNVLDEEFCKSVIQLFNQAESDGFGYTRKDWEDKDIPTIVKDDLSIFYNHTTLQIKILNHELIEKFHKVLWETCYSQYYNKYGALETVPPLSSFDIKIQKTKPGQGYHTWHCESGDRATSGRVLAWTVYLNDDFEAGETEFLYQQYRYKPSRGDVVIFPAAFTHLHRGNPPIGGDKYIITGWLEF